MFKMIFALAAVAAIAIFPVMYTARAVDAQRTGVWWVVAALFVQGALSKLLETVVSSTPLSLLINFLIGALVYQLMLETTYMKGLIISLVGAVVFVVGALLLVGVLGGTVNVGT